MPKLVQSGPTITRINKTKRANIEHVSEHTLNVEKMKLDEYFIEPTKETLDIVKKCDVYRPVVAKLADFNAQLPTNAWAKFYEIYSLISELIDTEIVLKGQKIFNAFCNAI